MILLRSDIRLRRVIYFPAENVSEGFALFRFALKPTKDTKITNLFVGDDDPASRIAQNKLSEQIPVEHKILLLNKLITKSSYLPAGCRVVTPYKH